jgi:hypothetical protein
MDIAAVSMILLIGYTLFVQMCVPALPVEITWKVTLFVLSPFILAALYFLIFMGTS